MSAPDRPSVALVEAVQMKLADAASREQDGQASVILTASEIGALRYRCSVFPLTEDIWARALRRAKSRSQGRVR